MRGGRDLEVDGPFLARPYAAVWRERRKYSATATIRIGRLDAALASLVRMSPTKSISTSCMATWGDAACRAMSSNTSSSICDSTETGASVPSKHKCRCKPITRTHRNAAMSRAATAGRVAAIGRHSSVLHQGVRASRAATEEYLARFVSASSRDWGLPLCRNDLDRQPWLVCSVAANESSREQAERLE